jgi:DTW domain-containing protein YfiP
LRSDHCLCAEIPRVENRSPFLVLRHIKEVWKTSNSARLAALALTQCQLVTYGTPAGVRDFGPLIPAGAWVLFPESMGPKERSEAGPTHNGTTPPRGTTVVVLDGTWHQAKRMLHRVDALHGLPRLSFRGPAGVPRLRRPTVSGGMSTLEAIAAAVEVLEGEAPARALRALHDTFVRRGLQLRTGVAATGA